MAASATLDVKSGLSGAINDLTKMARQINDVQKKASGGAGVAKFAAAFTLVSAGVSKTLDFLGDFIDQAQELSKIRSNFNVVFGSAERGAEVFKSLQSAAESSTVATKSLGQAYIDLAVPLDNNLTLIEGFAAMISDVALGSTEKFEVVMRELTQAMNANKVSWENIRSIGTQGVPIINLLADSMGKTAAEIQKMTAAGQLAPEELVRAFKVATDEGGKFFGGQAEALKTATGRWDAFKESLGNMFSTLYNTIEPVLVKIISGFEWVVDRIKDEVNRWETSFSIAASMVKNSGALIVEYIKLMANQVGYWMDYASVKIGDFTGGASPEQKRMLAQSEMAVLQNQKNIEEIRVRGLQSIVAAHEKYNATLVKDDSNTAKQRLAIEEYLNNAKRPQGGGSGAGPNISAAINSEIAAYQKLYGERAALEAGYQTARQAQIQLESEQLLKQGMDAIAVEKWTQQERNRIVTEYANKQKTQIAQATSFIAGNMASAFGDLATAMKGAGKNAKAFLVAQKALAISEATINTYIGFTAALKTQPSFLAIPMAATILAAGLAKVAAISATPIKAETGLQNYIVPQGFNNDNFPVAAKTGEQVTVTPVGEDAQGSTSTINLVLNGKVLSSVLVNLAQNGTFSLSNTQISKAVTR